MVHEQAIKDRAVSVILAHNHPSLNPEPSNDDIITTKNIIQSFSYIGINVFDHIIVSGDKFYSFSKNGIIDELKKDCSKFFLEKFAESNKQWTAE